MMLMIEHPDEDFEIIAAAASVQTKKVEKAETQKEKPFSEEFDKERRNTTAWEGCLRGLEEGERFPSFRLPSAMGKV